MARRNDPRITKYEARGRYGRHAGRGVRSMSAHTLSAIVTLPTPGRVTYRATCSCGLDIYGLSCDIIHGQHVLHQGFAQRRLPQWAR